MKKPPFAPETYVHRRRLLQEDVPQKPVILLGNTYQSRNFPANTFPFRQDSSLLYFSGIDIPNVHLVLYPEKGAILYADAATADDQIWTGPETPLEVWAEWSGIEHIKPLDRLASDLEKSSFMHLPPYQLAHYELLQHLTGKSMEHLKRAGDVKLIKAIIKQREIKSAEEVAEIEKALSVTKELHEIFLHHCLTGSSEQIIAGNVLNHLSTRGCELAYGFIISERGEILHNHHQVNTLKENSLVVGDIGAESHSHYASDITRTYPTNRTFTPLQKDLYQLVLKAQEEAIQMMRPKATFLSLHKLASKVMVEGLIEMGLYKGDASEIVHAGAHALLFPHGLGHAMGLDVHDMENLGEDFVGYDSQIQRSDIFGINHLRFGKFLKQGMVMTVEPGLYFNPFLIAMWKSQHKFSQWINYNKLEEMKDFGGIRIEDNVLVTADGYQVLGAPIPKTIEEISG